VVKRGAEITFRNKNLILVPIRLIGVNLDMTLDEDQNGEGLAVRPAEEPNRFP